MLSYRRIHLRMFLEDIEVSISSINLNTITNSIASIDIVPHTKFLNIPPGTNVAVFYKDNKASDYKTLTYTEYFELDATTQNLVDSYDDYSLLFMGHVTSYHINRASTSRSASLECEGDMDLLSRFQTYISNVRKDLLTKNKGFVGASPFFSTNTGNQELANRITECFTTDKKIRTPGFSTLTGPARGFISTIEHAMGATDTKEDINPKGAQQEYFAIANKQSKLLYQFGAVEVDNSVNGLLQSNETKVLLERSVNTSSGLSDLLSLLKKIMSTFYYKIYPVTTSVTDVGIEKNLELDGGMTVAEEALKTDNLNKLISPGSTVTTEDLNKALIDDTILDLAKSPLFNSIQYWGALNHGESSIKDILGTMLKGTIEARCSLRHQNQIFDNLRILLTDIYINTIFNEAPVKDARLINIINSFTNIRMQIATAINESKNVSNEDKKYLKILNYLLLPDLFFAAPPTCNVLFPNQITSYNYQSEGFDRATRLMLYTSSVITENKNNSEDDVKTKAYFAPSSENFLEFQNSTTIKKSLPLLKHELHTGIVPVIKEISFLEARNVQNTAVNASKDTTYLKLANFQLLDERFKDERISATGPFNPFVCPGFPCVIMDTDADSIKKEPTIFIGLLQNVSHNINTNNATTNYSITHARTFDEVDELFLDAVLTLNKKQGSSGKSDSSPSQLYKTINKLDVTITNSSPRREELYQFLLTIFLDVAPSSDSNVQDYFIYSTKPLLKVEAVELDIDAGRVKISSVPVLSAFFNNNIFIREENNLTSVKAVETIWEESYLEINIALAYWLEERDVEGLKIGANKFKDVFIYLLEEANIEQSQIASASSALYKLSMDYITVYDGDYSEDTWDEYILIRGKPKYYDKLKNKTLFNFYVPQKWFETTYKIISQNLLGTESTVIKSKFLTADSLKFEIFAVKDSLISLSSDGVSVKSVVSEELYRPSWYGESFSVANIGKNVYKKLLESNSVQSYLAGSGIETDAVLVNKNTGQLVDVYSTKLSVLYAAYIYKNIQSSIGKENFVDAYVRRPITNMVDVVGPKGFFIDKDSFNVFVSDYSKDCPEGNINEEEKVKNPSIDPDTVIEEKREACNTYEVVTRKRVFR